MEWYNRYEDVFRKLRKYFRKVGEIFGTNFEKTVENIKFSKENFKKNFSDILEEIMIDSNKVEENE